MGVKSTVTLTREQAESKLREHLYKCLGSISSLENSELQNMLESVNDSLSPYGEGLENYWIKEENLND